jgi:hypothetical protein
VAVAAVEYAPEAVAAAAVVVAAVALASAGAAGAVVVAVVEAEAAAGGDRTSVSSTISRFWAGSTTAWESIASAITAATKCMSAFWRRK